MPTCVLAPSRPTSRRAPSRTLLSLSIAAALGTAAPLPALAQSGDAAQPVAETSQQRQFNIEGGPLDAVLNRFALDAGMDLSVSTDLTRGKTSPGLQGRYSLEQALRTLLAGSGLSYGFAGENRVTLVAAQEGDGPMRLGPIRVEGTAEAPPPSQDPVEGYKADFATTATRTPLPIRETPASIGVVTEDFIEDTGATSRDEALEQVSGVSRGGRSFGQDVVMRGFRLERGPQEGSGEIETNGLIFSALRPLDPAIIERIEVSKGPSSIVSGAGSPGGTLNIITKRPQAENFAHFSQELGSFGRAKSVADLNGILPTTDTVRARLVATYSPDTGSFVDDVEGEETNIAASLEIDTFDVDGLLRLSARYQDFEGQSYRGFPLMASGEAPPIARETNIGGGDDSGAFNEEEVASLQAEYEHEFVDGLTLTARGGYGTSERDQLDVYAFQPGGIPASGDVTLYASDRQADFESWAGEVYIGKDVNFFDQNHHVLIGVDYLDQKNESFLAFSNTVTDNIFNLQNPLDASTASIPFLFQDNTIDFKQTGLFGQALIRPVDRLTLTLGGRQEWVELNRDDPLRDRLTFEDERNAFTGRIGASFEATPWVNVYATFQESFQVQESAQVTGERVPPETGESYEVGAKFDLLGGKLGVTTALFRTYRQNVATSDPNNPGFSIVTGEQRHQGVELDLNGEPLPGLRISGQFSYLDAEITEDTNAAVVGNSPSFVPRDYMGRIFATYEFNSGALEGFGFGGGAFFHSGFVIDRANEFKTDPFMRLDAVTFYRPIESVKLSLNLKNITDETYIESPGTVSQGNHFGAPFSVFGTISVRF